MLGSELIAESGLRGATTTRKKAAAGTGKTECKINNIIISMS